MNDWRAGFSKALLSPRMNASTPISQTLTEFVTVRSPRISAWMPITACSAIITLRLFTRSAMTPP